MVAFLRVFALPCRAAGVMHLATAAGCFTLIVCFQILGVESLIRPISNSISNSCIAKRSRILEHGVSEFNNRQRSGMQSPIFLPNLPALKRGGHAHLLGILWLTVTVWELSLKNISPIIVFSLGPALHSKCQEGQVNLSHTRNQCERSGDLDQV